MPVRVRAALIAMGLALLFGGNCPAQALSPLGDLPDYRRLDAFQETMTREEFTARLQCLYAPHGGYDPFIAIEGDHAVLRKTSVALDDLYTLRFAADGSAPKPVAQATFWRSREQIPPAGAVNGKPLAGVKIVLDPGHIGGRWARLEERWFRIGDAPPVMEGVLTLQVAQRLAERLHMLGAESVRLVREQAEPVTEQRPADFLELARSVLMDRGIRSPAKLYDGESDPLRITSVLWTAENLFTRADIRARATLINQQLRPDLVVCLHCNAEAWGDPSNPQFVEKNHVHVLVNGCYEPDEVVLDDVRFEMLLRLLARMDRAEIGPAVSVATALANATGLPPYQYTGPNALHVSDSPYVWARNLLANRLYGCPVVYAEPYVMNSAEVFARVQAGDYEGTRDFGGVQRQSIVREYSGAVADGLAAYYGQRPTK